MNFRGNIPFHHFLPCNLIKRLKENNLMLGKRLFWVSLKYQSRTESIFLHLLANLNVMYIGIIDISDYCRRHGLTTIDVRELSESSLFNNTAIKRRLSAEAIVIILQNLETRGNLEWIDKTKNRAHIYWRSPEEWGSLIYTYVKGRGMINTVCTFYELTEGSDTVDQKFHGLENELLIKSLKTLELQRKAEIFADDEGVKFF